MPDIIINPNRTSLTGIPQITFVGASGSGISLQVLQNGDVSFVGPQGQLFGVGSSLTGSLMSVNDIAGLPILEVFDSDKVVMGSFGANAFMVSGSGVAMGYPYVQPNYRLAVSGDVSFLGHIYSGNTNIASLFVTSGTLTTSLAATGTALLAALSGAISGVASQSINITTGDGSATNYVLFCKAQSGTESLRTEKALTFNDATNTLNVSGTITAQMFSGNGRGITGISISGIGAGIASASTFLRGDGMWASPPVNVVGETGAFYGRIAFFSGGTSLRMSAASTSEDGHVSATQLYSESGIAVGFLHDSEAWMGSQLWLSRTNSGRLKVLTGAAQIESIAYQSDLDVFAPIAISASASDLVTGTVAPERLGAGVASSSTYLRGDNTWATITPPEVDAGDVDYDNGDSGLTATNVQAAIDELAGGGGGGGGSNIRPQTLLHKAGQLPVLIGTRSYVTGTALSTTNLGPMNTVAWQPHGHIIAQGYNSWAMGGINIYQKAGTTLTNATATVSNSATGAFQKMRWTPDGEYLTVGYDTSPNLQMLAVRDTATVAFSGVANVVGGPSAVRDLAWSLNGEFLAVADDTSAIKVYDRSGITLTARNFLGSEPSTTGGGTCIAWTPDGNQVAVGYDTSVRIYNNGRVSTQMTNLFTITGFGGNPSSLSFSPNGSHLAIGHSSSPYVSVYQIDDEITYTKLADASVLPTDSVNVVAWSHSSENLAVGGKGSPYLNVYNVAGSTLVRHDTMSAATIGTIKDLCWSTDDSYLAVAYDAGAGVKVFKSNGVK